MKRTALLYIFVFASSFFLSANRNDSIRLQFANANKLYKQELYSDAARVYESILELSTSPELYYNLANSYFKSDELALAILNYERALRLKPNFRNARYNLKIAEDKVIDNVNATPAFWARRFTDSFIKLNSSNTWAYISYAFLLVFLTTILVFSFAKSRTWRKIAFYAFILSATVSLLSFIFSGIRKNQFIRHSEAIVLEASVAVKNAPDKQGSDLFLLHEGSKVHVKSNLDGWSEIKLDNGAVGWIENTSIERI